MLWLSFAGACGGSTPTSPSGTSCGPLPAGNSATLNTGDMFRLRFRVPSGRNPDVMFSIIGLADGPTAWRASFRLYDGATQLGVQDDIHDGSGILQESGQSLRNAGQSVRPKRAGDRDRLHLHLCRND